MPDRGNPVGRARTGRSMKQVNRETSFIDASSDACVASSADGFANWSFRADMKMQ
jgi:hypothetical protein